MAIARPNTPGTNPTGNPFLDSLIWGSSWGGSTITFSFDNGTVGDRGFTSAMKSAVRMAFNTIEKIIPVTFLERPFLTPTGQVAEVNVTYALTSVDTLGGAVGFHEVPGETPFLANYGLNTLIGAFGFDSPIFTAPGLKKGGEGFATILHEILHGLGLAHPHDNGGGSSTFPGVTAAFDDYGIHGQNQGIYTIMSYNSGYAEKLPLKSYAWGSTATPMALDIAALQTIYGTTAHNTGNNVYSLRDVNGAGTYWSCIWDTGGVDTISAAGLNRNTVINLNDADLSGSDAGGVPSYAGGIRGGYTIANTVVIENAIGGNKSDRILGNEAANRLEGRAGNDILYGRDGSDVLLGSHGNDTLSGDNGSDRMIGGNGNDSFVAKVGDGDDVINGGNNSDWIRFVGSVGATVNLSNSTRQDTGYGMDTIVDVENASGTGVADDFTGSAGANVLNGGSGNDSLSGLGGNDRLNGGNHNDTLIGGGGRDTLNGGNGADAIFGGGGLDIMTGGAGADTFVFLTARESTASTRRTDKIKDFRPGQDKIDLSAIDASTVFDGDDAFVFRGQKPFGQSNQGEVYFEKVDAPGSTNDRTYVYLDTDGDRAPEMVIELTGLHNLTAGDFIL